MPPSGEAVERVCEKLSEVAGRLWGMETITIDCEGCSNRGPACSDCVVQVLLDITPAPGPVPAPELTWDEQQAVAALAGEGLVPPLRLLPAVGQRRSA